MIPQFPQAVDGTGVSLWNSTQLLKQSAYQYRVRKVCTHAEAMCPQVLGSAELCWLLEWGVKRQQMGTVHFICRNCLLRPWMNQEGKDVSLPIIQRIVAGAFVLACFCWCLVGLLVRADWVQRRVVVESL